MKKLLLAVLVITLFGLNVQAQNCTPDPMLADTTAGVYPLPDPIGSTMSSLATGCVGAPYEQLFTAVVPNSITVPVGMSEVPVALESVEVLEITGLPDGITYACEPEDCKYLKLTTGCLIFSGTPTTAGVYTPVVSTTGVTDGLGAIPVTFPGVFFPGEYKMTVLEADSPDAVCVVGVVNTLDEVLGVSQNIPNPFSAITNITIDSKVSGAFDFKVFSLIGEMIHNESFNLSTGENTISFDGTHLNSGMYFYSISQGNDIVTKRMIINK